MTQPSIKIYQNRATARDITIDSLRGIAIILMVAGHVIGGTSESGMRVDDGSAWRIFYLTLEDLRMPLFTALSGYVYALRPLTGLYRYNQFFTGKVKRLLVPLLSVGTLFVVLQSVTPGTNTDGDTSDFWRVYVYGTGHFWFLQAIFLILLLVGILDALNAFRSRTHISIAIMITSLTAILLQIPSQWNVFSLNGAIQLLPFFLLGYLLHHASLRRALFPLLVLTLCLLFLRFLNALEILPLGTFPSRTLGIVIGLVGIATLFSARDLIKLRWLAVLGFYSFSIYLLHVFATAPTRMALTRLGVYSETSVFLISLGLGLVLPVVFQLTLGRINWVSWLFLGQRPQHHSSKKAPARGKIGRRTTD